MTLLLLAQVYLTILLEILIMSHLHLMYLVDYQHVITLGSRQSEITAVTVAVDDDDVTGVEYFSRRSLSELVKDIM